MTNDNNKTRSQKMTVQEFYPYYLREHLDPTCRRLHYLGSSLALIVLATAIWQANAWWLVLVPVAGYGCAWIGHYFFEGNKPATFKYPTLSFIGDWLMFKDFLTGQLDQKIKQATQQSQHQT